MEGADKFRKMSLADLRVLHFATTQQLEEALRAGKPYSETKPIYNELKAIQYWILFHAPDGTGRKP